MIPADVIGDDKASIRMQEYNGQSDINLFRTNPP